MSKNSVTRSTKIVWSRPKFCPRAFSEVGRENSTLLVFSLQLRWGQKKSLVLTESWESKRDRLWFPSSVTQWSLDKRHTTNKLKLFKSELLVCSGEIRSYDEWNRLRCSLPFEWHWIKKHSTIIRLLRASPTKRLLTSSMRLQCVNYTFAVHTICLPKKDLAAFIVEALLSLSLSLSLF